MKHASKGGREGRKGIREGGRGEDFVQGLVSREGKSTAQALTPHTIHPTCIHEYIWVSARAFLNLQMLILVLDYGQNPTASETTTTTATVGRCE